MKTTMKTSKIIKMIAVAASLLVFGCAGTGGGYSYNRAAVGGALLDMGRTYTNYGLYGNQQPSVQPSFGPNPAYQSQQDFIRNRYYMGQ